MFCLQLYRPCRFRETDIPAPGLPGRGHITVRLGCALVCGSDIPYFNGTKPSMVFPLDAGRPIHECAGEVVQSSYGRFRTGDRVVAMPAGDRGLCDVFLARADEAVKIPDAVNDMATACLIQPLATVLAAVERLGPVKGQSVTVIGAGPIGLMLTWLLAERGARPVRVIDPVEDRCKQALELGASVALPLTSAQLATLLRSGHEPWPRAAVCVEAVGHQPATVNDALELVEEEGRILVLGVPDQPVYAFDFNKWFRRNLRMFASVAPDWPVYMGRAARLLARKPAPLSRLVTHRFDMHRAAEAFALAASKTDGALKVCIRHRRAITAPADS